MRVSITQEKNESDEPTDELVLPKIDFAIPPAQVDNLYEIVLSIEELEPTSSKLTDGVLQHINSALFLLHKLFS